MNVDGKRIVVTEAPSGIGRALVRQLSDCHVQIVAADIDDVRLREGVSSLDQLVAQVWAFTCDRPTLDQSTDPRPQVSRWQTRTKGGVARAQARSRRRSRQLG
jgi:NAD(P)-dependent dehydrogenase (short-subunit alcohol dehydrogenase family)